MTRNQLNVRVSDELERLIDKKRIQLNETKGFIPSRSDVVRYALENYLEVRLSDTDTDGRKAPARRMAGDTTA